MPLPPNEMNTFSEVAERWGVSVQSIEDYLLTDKLIASFFLKRTMLGKYTLVLDPDDIYSDDPYIYAMNYDYSYDSDFHIFESGIMDLCYKNLIWDEDGQTILAEGFNLGISWPHEEEGYYGLVEPCILKRNDVFITLSEIKRFETEHGIIPNFQSGYISEKAAVTAPVPVPKLHTKEKESLLKLLIVIAVDAYRYNPDEKKSAVPGEIADAAANLGISIDVDTVRKWLKEAAYMFLREKKTNEKPNSVC